MNKVRLVNMSLKRNIDINAKLKTLSEISSKKQIELNNIKKDVIATAGNLRDATK